MTNPTPPPADLSTERQPGQAARLRKELVTRLWRLHGDSAIATALVDGRLHPAVKIDWSALP